MKDTTATSSDTVSTALTQDNLELAYPISMGEDTMDSTEPTIDSKTTSSIITSNLEAVSRTQKNNALSNASVTARKTPDVESTTGDVDLSMPTLDDKNDNSTDIHHAGLLNETPGEFLFFCFNFIFSFFFSLLLFCGAAMSHSDQ